MEQYPVASVIGCVEDFGKALDSLAPADWQVQSVCEEWTIQDVAAHVTSDMDLVSTYLHNALSGHADALAPSYFAERKQQVANLNAASPERVRAEFRQAAARLLDLMRSVQPEDLLKTTQTFIGPLPVAGIMSIALYEGYIHTDDMLRPLERAAEMNREHLRALIALIVQIMPMMYDYQAAAGTRLIVALDITGEAGSPWTARVENSLLTVTPGLAPDADLVISADAETFFRVATGRLSRTGARGLLRLRENDIARATEFWSLIHLMAANVKE